MIECTGTVAKISARSGSATAGATGTATAYHVHGCSFLLRFPLSNIDYQDIPASLSIQTCHNDREGEGR